jgi:hypothetical protein
MDAERLFPRPLGIHCGPCPLLEVCGADQTDNACAPALDFSGPGGPFLLHPLRSDFDDHFERVGGAGFDDLAASRVVIPSFRPYLPQVKWLERLRREHLTAAEVPVVAVRLKEVFRGGRIRTAAELRAQTGLDCNIRIVLLLHAKDDLLERFDAAELTTQIASGGYDLVTAPSFSLWEPQRRPDNLLSLRRSLVYYNELQTAGASACPRVGWVETLDGDRLAAWIKRHDLSLVSLDLMTYDGASFDRAVAGLARFDELTGQRLHYLIDGVRVQRKIEALYLAAEPVRVTISSATMAVPAPTIEGVPEDSFLARTRHIADRCDAGSRAVRTAHTSSVEGFISATLAEPTAVAAVGTDGVRDLAAFTAKAARSGV